MLERIITYEPGRHDACDVMHSSCIYLQYRLNRKVYVYKLATAGLIRDSQLVRAKGNRVPLMTVINQ